MPEFQSRGSASRLTRRTLPARAVMPPGLFKAGHGGVLSFAERFGVAEGGVVHFELLESLRTVLHPNGFANRHRPSRGSLIEVQWNVHRISIESNMRPASIMRWAMPSHWIVVGRIGRSSGG